MGLLATVTAKILGFPKQPLENWVRLHGKGQLKGEVLVNEYASGQVDRSGRLEKSTCSRINGSSRLLHNTPQIPLAIRETSIKVRLDSQQQKHWPVSVACEMLGVSTSGYFENMRRKGAYKAYKPGTNKRISNEAELAHIRAIHPEVKQEYGWPKMWKELVARGIRMGTERMRRTMQENGIKARGKRKFVVNIATEPARYPTISNQCSPFTG